MLKNVKFFLLYFLPVSNGWYIYDHLVPRLIQNVFLGSSSWITAYGGFIQPFVVHEICVLMYLGFFYYLILIIVEKSVFVKAIEAVWIPYQIGSHQFQTNQAAFWPGDSFANQPRKFWNMQNSNLISTVSGWSGIYASRN